MAQHKQFLEWVTRWYIRNAKEYLAKGGSAIIVGKEPAIKGLLCISDGTTLENMIKENMISRKQMDPFSPVHDGNNFIKYVDGIEETSHLDGAFLYDDRRGMARVGTIFPPPKRVEDLDIRDYTPAELGMSNKSVGEKTKVAFWLPQLYNEVYTVAARQTSSGPTGYGTILGFDKEGLRDRIYLAVEKGGWGPFIDEERGVVCIHEKYENTGKGIECVEKSFVHIKDGNLYHLSTMPAKETEEDVVVASGYQAFAVARLLAFASPL